MNNEKIKFKYIFEDNYNPVYINGAYGGLDPGGELTVNFYLERKPVPKQITHIIKEDGSLGDIIGSNFEDDERLLIRYVSVGTTMSLKTAKQIYEWLGEHIKEAEELE